MIPRELFDGFQHFARDKPSLGRAWLFGTRALGTANKESDWDIAIELRLPIDAARTTFFESLEVWTNELQRETGLLTRLDLFNPPETANVSRAVYEHGILFFLPWSALVHESGHLVVGAALGNREQGILLGIRYLNVGDMAGASGRPQDPEIGVKRSLAGLIACVAICGDTFSAELFDALKVSVVPAESHPMRKLLLAGESLAATGFQSDLDYSRAYAAQICGEDLKKIDIYLQEQEAQVNALVVDRRETIEAVAADLREWLATVNLADNKMVLYPPTRALEVIRASRAS